MNFKFKISDFRFLILAALAVVCFTGCEPKEPERPILDSYPRKHLIEEFTGQDCGYCPYGMDCIHAFMADDPNFVLILHHYGYKKDHFSVAGSKTITNALGVDGAPSVAIDRAKVNYGSGKGVVFYPGDLETTKKSQFDTTTYASIFITNEYKASSRKLTIRVSGEISEPWAEDLHLTVLIKESGMIDYQADYYETKNGWKEFCHTNAVRAFLTAPKGDEMDVRERRYKEKYTIELDESWVPENCMVVAFITEGFQPVVQVEQTPVIAGTAGGADIEHGGITKK